MLVGGVYASYDNPPNTSMFLRAGGSKSKKSEAISLSEAASQITTRVSSKEGGAGEASPPPPPPNSSTSPPPPPPQTDPTSS